MLRRLPPTLLPKQPDTRLILVGENRYRNRYLGTTFGQYQGISALGGTVYLGSLSNFALDPAHHVAKVCTNSFNLVVLYLRTQFL